MTGAGPLSRYRVAYTKSSELKYTGHLDLHRIWERSLRRARLPLAYSQGFHPQPRIQMANALPLGFTSTCELVDLWLEVSSPVGEIQAALEPVLPQGIIIHSVVEVDLHKDALQSSIISAQYVIQFLETIDEEAIQAKVCALLANPTLPRERKGKSYDLRPLVEELFLLTEPSRLVMRLSAKEGATGRPEEVLSCLGIQPNLTKIERVKLFFRRE